MHFLLKMACSSLKMPTFTREMWRSIKDMPWAEDFKAAYEEVLENAQICIRNVSRAKDSI